MRPQELSDPTWLENKYVTEQLSMLSIANLLGISEWPVREALRAYKIKVRSASERATIVQSRLPHKPKRSGTKFVRPALLDDKQALISQYVNSGWPAKRIGDNVGVSLSTVLNALRTFGVTIRGPQVPFKLPVGLLADPDWTYSRLVIDRLSLRATGALAGTKPHAVTVAVKTHHIIRVSLKNGCMPGSRLLDEPGWLQKRLTVDEIPAERIAIALLVPFEQVQRKIALVGC